MSEKLPSRRIRPNRFVWHISYTGNDNGIATQGLLTNREGYVYVNNHSYSLEHMWPFPIDRWDWMGSPFSYDELYSGYTFWRIDTRICRAVWEVDPILAGEYWVYGCLTPGNYIRTAMDIPVEALCPFRYTGNNYSHIRVQKAQGTASAGCRASGLRLREDYPLWNWMKWRLTQPGLSRAA